MPKRGKLKPVNGFPFDPKKAEEGCIMEWHYEYHDDGTRSAHWDHFAKH